MGKLLADIFVTIRPTKRRQKNTIRSLQSLMENTDRDDFRLTLCFDGISDEGSFDPYDPYLAISSQFMDDADHIIISKENEGLGPMINRTIAFIKNVNGWFEDEHVGDPNQVSSSIVMCQDDLLYNKDWLPKLFSRYIALGHKKIGFATGLECVEHPIKEKIDDGMLLKDWIRASQMLAIHDYWYDLMPIPAFDPETKALRGKPNDGLGSGVDWWMIRNHPQSVCKSGRTCLVIPGLVQHIGYDSSTWLDRELPESDEDKEKMKL